jgi:hypothetical protein
VESEDADRGFRTLIGDFEQVTRALNEVDDVIDMDRNISCGQYITQASEKKQFRNLKNVLFSKVSRGSTLLTRLPRIVSPCDKGLARQSRLFSCVLPRTSLCGLARAARHTKKGSPVPLAPTSLRLALCQERRVTSRTGLQ